jgi:hypothetical protein
MLSPGLTPRGCSGTVAPGGVTDGRGNGVAYGYW